MDEIGFRRFLKKAGKQEHVIEGLVGQVRAFEAYLRSQDASLESAAQPQLEAYLAQLKPDEGKVRIRGVVLYFMFSGNTALAEVANRFRDEGVARTRAAYKLHQFRGVKLEDAARLEALGVASTEDMLRAGATPAARQELAEHTGLPLGLILELVKLSDLSRIEGVKGIRARLYVDAGVDTLDKLAGWEVEALRGMLVEWAARTGFEGIAPLPKELANTIAAARRLPRVAAYPEE